MAGRPKKIIDYELVKSLAEIQCTQAEIAAVLKLSVDTLSRDETFCGIYKTAMNNGKMCLRRLQWKRAMEGCDTMLIWLGKQYLGQFDKQQIDANVSKPAPVIDDDSKTQ